MYDGIENISTLARLSNFYEITVKRVNWESDDSYAVIHKIVFLNENDDFGWAFGDTYFDGDLAIEGRINCDGSGCWQIFHVDDNAKIEVIYDPNRNINYSKSQRNNGRKKKINPKEDKKKLKELVTDELPYIILKDTTKHYFNIKLSLAISNFGDIYVMKNTQNKWFELDTVFDISLFDGSRSKYILKQSDLVLKKNCVF